MTVRSSRGFRGEIEWPGPIAGFVQMAAVAGIEATLSTDGDGVRLCCDKPWVRAEFTRRGTIYEWTDHLDFGARETQILSQRLTQCLVGHGLDFNSDGNWVRNAFRLKSFLNAPTLAERNPCR